MSGAPLFGNFDDKSAEDLMTTGEESELDAKLIDKSPSRDASDDRLPWGRRPRILTTPVMKCVPREKTDGKYPVRACSAIQYGTTLYRASGGPRSEYLHSLR